MEPPSEVNPAPKGPRKGPEGPDPLRGPSPGVYQCVACGACCAAPDISTLGKPLGVPCRHLGADMRCGIYADRPAVCRGYQPDWVCAEVAPLPTLDARVAKFLEIYGLTAEAETQASPGLHD